MQIILGILVVISILLVGTKMEKKHWWNKGGERVIEFTEDTTVEEILKDPRFRIFSNLFALSDSRNHRKKTIKDLCESTITWKSAEIPYGLNTAAKQIEQGVNFFQRFYTEKEIELDPTKEQTGLFYFPSKIKNTPFVLVIPGGAYIDACVTVEGFPVAAKLNEEGLNVFVLAYRTGHFFTGSIEKASEDLLTSLKYIESMANEYSIDTQQYLVIGFSAGGHLASTLGTESYSYETSGISKPGALILSYPLVDFQKGGLITFGCKVAGFGLFAGNKKLKKAYVPDYLSNNCPPLFIWAGRNDSVLPFENNAQTIYEKALDKDISCELLAFNDAEHGLGIAKGSEAEEWLNIGISFWEKHTMSNSSRGN